VALLRVEEEVRGHLMLVAFPFISHPISLSITELHSLLCSSYSTGGDWEVYSDDRLPILERRMQDILRGIESREVIDDSTPSSSAAPSPVSTQPANQRRGSKVDPGSSSGTVTGSRSGSGSSSSSSKPLSSSMRQLCQDFMEIPFETMPDYR
jgi:hypothetical protein